MPGWYDIMSFDTLNRTDDETGILRSRQVIHGLINDQIAAGIPARRIILGGFSQGGAMSLFSGLTFKERLAGVFGLSCYQLMPSKFEGLHKEAGSHKPLVFMGHGTADPLVKVEWGRMTAEGLRKVGIDVNWNEYAGLPHSADPAEIDQLERWVEARLGESEGSASSG